MDVVADACSIRRVEVVAEDAQRRCDPQSGSESEGNQMRLRVMQLADRPAGMSSCRIEVTQGNGSHPMRDRISSQRVFEKQFCRSVRIDGRLRVRLGNGQGLRNSV